MVPKTENEMFETIVRLALSRVYVDVTEAARRGRLTEHDISLIERRVIDILRDPAEFGHEIEGFEAEIVHRNAQQYIKQLFATIQVARRQKVEKK